MVNQPKMEDKVIYRVEVRDLDKKSFHLDNTILQSFQFKRGFVTNAFRIDLKTKDTHSSRFQKRNQGVIQGWHIVGASVAALNTQPKLVLDQET